VLITPVGGAAAPFQDLVRIVWGRVVAPQGQSGHTRTDKLALRQKSCMKTSALNQGSGGQSSPRSAGFSVAFIQSAPPWAGAQLARLSSARANNSASFGSFPDESGVRRLSMQSMPARRAGRLSPRQDQPEICKAGSSIRLRKPRQEPGPSLAPA